MLGQALPDACADARGWLTLDGIGDAPVYLSLRRSECISPAPSRVAKLIMVNF